ncbi:hypothetical protein CU044_1411 [Streptomyces sp. L-9-10]|nr:hypothetical protein CU044_1411 [Streptomyces sp. L-9-10]
MSVRSGGGPAASEAATRRAGPALNRHRVSLGAYAALPDG